MNASSAAPLAGPAIPSSPDQQKLRKASQEFEAILIAEWWKSATTGIAGLSESEETGMGAFRDFGQQAMAMAIAQSGGLGLGRMMFERLDPAARQHALPSAGPWASGAGSKAWQAVEPRDIRNLQSD